MVQELTGYDIPYTGVINHLEDISSKKNSLICRGFSVRNLYNIKRFYLFYSQGKENLHQFGASLKEAKHQDYTIRQNADDKFENHLIFQIPRGHHVEIFIKCKSAHEALVYVKKTIENGWSRAMLINFIDVDLYKTQGKSINNFDRLFPDTQSNLAKETLKDPYNFDFLTLSENYKEKELEDALVSNITKFLLELGQGFAYIGRQYPIQIGNKSRNIDLLFYHLELLCYVVIELKVNEFQPEHAGKLGYYIAAVNNQLKKEADNPTIGLLICKTKDNIEAKYSLESSSQPIGISEYK